MPIDNRTKLLKRVASLREERSSFINHWQDIAQFIAPRRFRFMVTERNRGTKMYGSILNGKATWSLREAAAGLFTGTMSPARPWHRLRAKGDPALNDYAPVKEWLHFVTRQQRELFNDSNLYPMAHLMLKDVLLFGTACMAQEADEEKVARFFTEPAGTFMVAQDHRGKVNTLVREKELTAEQIIGKFGREKASIAVKTAYDRGNYDSTFEVIHYVGPNENYEEGNPFPHARRFKSWYYEVGNINRDVFLRKSGFHTFPFYTPRWEVTGNDTYATDCPGMQSLGDVRSLQTQERVKARAVAKMADPPLAGPPSLRNVPIRQLPGGSTLYDGGGANQNKLAPVYQVDPKVGELNIDIQRTEERIDKAFFVDLFRAISSMDGVQPRNQLELSQRNQEALLQLGPALQRLQQDFFEHLIDRTFDMQVERGMLPPPPKELAGQDLEVQYVSALSMAQQQVTTGNVERLAAFTGSLAQQGFADALDKFDADAAVDSMAEAIGAPPELVRSDDEVDSIREQRAQAQQQERQAALQSQEAQDVAALASAQGGGA